ncbi:MAG: Gfo/Idh/MocA family oxidoreductase [Thermogutta sp.]|nr:Gfo/Idh/MocA family oxidoreductase [Thermogutta sp.]
MKRRQSETAGKSGDQRHKATGTSRRDFLRTTGAAAAIGMSGLSLARGAHAAGEDPILKIALIGCGGRGTGAAANALDADPRTRLTAMADAFEDRLNGSLASLKEKYADRVDVTPDTAFAGLDAYAKAIQSDVDVVLLCEPPHFRPRHLRAAVDAGKHIFCEKPVAVDAPGYRSVLESTEIAKQKGLSLVSGLCWRYHNATRETIQRIQDGAIGEIVTIQETYNTGHIGGRPRDPALTEMQFQVRNWYCFTWLSGDHNVEQHIHSLDKALWVMHDEPPAAAWGLGGRQVRTEMPRFGNIYDHHAVCYEYANGVRVYSYCRQHANCWNDTTDHVFGTKGLGVILNDFRIDGPEKWRYQGENTNMYVAEHQALFHSIRAGEPINNGIYMARSTMMAIMGRMATYTGQRLTWEQATQSEENLSPSSYDWNATPPIMLDAEGRYPVAIPGITKFV